MNSRYQNQFQMLDGENYYWYQFSKGYNKKNIKNMQEKKIKLDSQKQQPHWTNVLDVT